MLRTTNQDGCQGNVRPAEDSGMTPTIDVDPPCGFNFYGGPGGKATQGNNKSLGFPDFCFRFPKPSLLFVFGLPRGVVLYHLQRVQTFTCSAFNVAIDSLIDASIYCLQSNHLNAANHRDRDDPH